MGTEVSQMSLVSQQQPWHPAWSRQWIPQSTMQNDAGPPQKPQTIGNDQYVTPLTPNMKTGGMWFTFPQLAGGANVTFLNPSLALSIEVERDSPSQWQSNCKTKNWMAQRKWQNGSYCYWYNNTYRREYFFFQKWGGRQTYWMLSRQRRENSVHSTFSTNKEWKRRGGLCQPVLDVNYDHYMSFHKISSSLVG